MPPVVPPVAEVVARYRGRIVDIRHIRWSEPPALTPAAYLGAGAVMLLVGLGLALRGLAQVACSVPPCPAAPTGAGLGVVLVGLGLIPLVLGLVRWRDRTGARYVIGDAFDVDLNVALAGPAREGLPLVIALERDLVLGLPPGACGDIDGPGPIDIAAAIAQGRTSLVLPAGRRARVELGELSFEIQHVPPAALARPALEIDRLAWLSHAAAAVILGGLFMSLGTASISDLEVEGGDPLARVATYLTAIPSPPSAAPPSAPTRRRPAAKIINNNKKNEARPEPPPAPSVVVDAASGLVAPTSPSVLVRRHKGGTGRTDSEYDYDRVAGVLGDEGFGDAVDNFTVTMRSGQRAYAATAESDSFWAAATGGPPRVRGFGGLELAETERGGGVHPDKPRAAQRPGPSVTLTAPPTSMPPPTPEEEAKIRRIINIEMDPPNLAADPGLDRYALYQYARAKIGAWRTCYEAALDKDPGLGGVTKLVVHFNARGRVTRATVSWTTLGIGAIDPCIIAAVKRWKLAPNSPKPTTAIFNLQFSARSR